MKSEGSSERASERPSADRVDRLKALYELSMTLAGDPVEVFDRIVRMIGEHLAVPIVCLSEIRDGSLHFLSVYNRGRVAFDAGQCALDITPCATVEATKDIRVYDRVAERFPDASFLKQHNASAYCGFPSLDNDGNVVAVTCLLDDKPHEFTAEDLELLRVFGQRIGMEIERHQHLDERRRAEDALRDAESRFRALIENALDIITVIDADGTIRFQSPSVTALLGYEPDEMIGRSAFEFIHEEDRSDIAITHHRDRLKKASAPRRRRPLGLHLLQGETAGLKSSNMIKMLEAKQIALGVIIARRRG